MNFKTLPKFILALLLISSIYSCSSSDDSDEDCTKTIVIPQIYFVGGQSYRSDTTQEVPCDFPDAVELEVVEPPFLAEFSYEILFFEFIPDTGNNTRIIRFEIELKNESGQAVSGIPISTVRNENFTSTGPSFVTVATNACTMIPANSSCVFSVDLEESLNTGMLNELEILEVQYLVTD